MITSWTHDSKVLCLNEQGRVFTTENKYGDWEKWRVCKSKDNDGVVILPWLMDEDWRTAAESSIRPSSMTEMTKTRL